LTACGFGRPPVALMTRPTKEGRRGRRGQRAGIVFR